jgi:hypothetical protein
MHSRITRVGVGENDSVESLRALRGRTVAAHIEEAWAILGSSFLYNQGRVHLRGRTGKAWRGLRRAGGGLVYTSLSHPGKRLLKISATWLVAYTE